MIDAGSGAGLITIAALAGGALHVIAIDSDPAAVHATAANVEAVLGSEASSRLSCRELDFADLDDITADALVVNPPQRPARILHAVEPEQRHLHEGGDDGLEAIRSILRHARTPVVRTTAVGILPIETMHVDGGRWQSPIEVLSEELPLHASWAEIAGPRHSVGVWDFVART